MVRESYSVLGLARSGVAAANALARRGASVLISDLRSEQKVSPFLARLEPSVDVRLGENVVRDGDVVVASPGIPPRAPIFAECRTRGLEVIGEVALFQRLAPDVPILAVTGTDGKSTTTTWLGEMIAASGRPTWVGGNLGTPLCEALAELSPNHVVVAEVSCFQLTTSPELHPRVAVYTNLAPDHLDYYDGSFEAYVAAKARLMGQLTAGEAVVLNADDALLGGWAAPEGAATCWYSAHGARARRGVFVEDGALVSTMGALEEHLVGLGELQVPGAHNVENAMAAAAGALAFGVGADAVRAALRAYRGLEHRIERVREVGGITWYNDSKATNPHAGEAALRAFDEPIVLICGGSDKAADFGPWADLATEHVRHAICCGATAARIEAAIDGRIPTTRTDTLAEAVQAARDAAGGRGVVVLSPVCASFDQFDNFEHRGRVFKSLVEALDPPG